jgi:dihydrofolate reductase
MGRKAYAMASDPDTYADSYEFRVPIFVLTHTPPEKHPKETGDLTFTFVTDGIQSAVTQAKAAAGDKDVTIVGGARVIRDSLKHNLVDELHIDVMPVILGAGLQLFEDLGAPRIHLERIKVVEISGGRTHLAFRIV